MFNPVSSMPHSFMKSLLVLLLAGSLAPPAISGPIRVLYLDAGGKEQVATGPLHAAMRDLGRDAIWFEYAKATWTLHTTWSSNPAMI